MVNADYEVISEILMLGFMVTFAVFVLLVFLQTFKVIFQFIKVNNRLGTRQQRIQKIKLEAFGIRLIVFSILALQILEKILLTFILLPEVCDYLSFPVIRLWIIIYVFRVLNHLTNL